MPKVFLSGQARPEPKAAPAPTPAGDVSAQGALTPPADPASTQQTTSEPVKSTPPPPTPNNHDDAFARLAKQERELREEKAAIKAERDALEAARTSKPTPEPTRSGNITDDLASLGYSYDQVVEHFLKNPPDPNDKRFHDLESKILTRMDEREEREKADREAAQKAEEARVSEAYQRETTRLHSTAKSVVENDKDGKYGMVKALGEVALGSVVPRIESRFLQDNTMLSPEQALAELEQATEAEFTKILDAKIPRIEELLRKRYGASAPPPAEPKPTLTHRNTATQTQRQGTLSKAEMRQRMIDRINQGRQAS